MRRLDVDRETVPHGAALAWWKNLWPICSAPLFCSSSPSIDRQCWPEFGTLLGRPQASGGRSSTLGLRKPSRALDMERTTFFNLRKPQ